MNRRLILRFLLVPVVALCVIISAGCWSPKASVPTVSTTPSASVTPTSASLGATSEPVPGSVATPSTDSGYLKTTPPKPPAPGTTKPTDDEIIAAAVRLEKGAGDIDTITSTKVLGVTQDSKKLWWAYLVMNQGQSDQLQLVLFNNGKAWDLLQVGLTLDYNDMPPDVRF